MADLLSKDNESIKNSLFVSLKQNLYLMYRKDKDELGLQDATQVMFNDGQSAYRRFGSIYGPSAAQKVLAAKIAEKIYKYGFLND